MMLGRLIGMGAVVLALGLTTAPASHASTSSVSVPANASAGVGSLWVEAGALIDVSASGSAGYGYEGAAPCTGYPTTDPDGNRYLGSTNCGPKDDPNATLSGDATGELIARIGNGGWFSVGSGDDFYASQAGTLILAYNDSIYSDNTGSYSVFVINEGRCPPDGCIHGCPPSGCVH